MAKQTTKLAARVITVTELESFHADCVFGATKSGTRGERSGYAMIAEIVAQALTELSENADAGAAQYAARIRETLTTIKGQYVEMAKVMHNNNHANAYNANCAYAYQVALDMLALY